MKLLVLSDLHVEFGPYDLPDTDVDVVILAGDVHVKTYGIKWIRDQFHETPVIYVPGNHEFYGKAILQNTEELRCEASDTNIHLLDNDSVYIDGIQFLGCTLWTDFELFGNGSVAKAEARNHMRDYRKIISNKSNYRKVSPNDIARLHLKSKQWLKKALEKSPPGSTIVVVTHHAPSILSVEPVHRSDPISAAYASCMDDMGCIVDSRPHS